MLRNVIVHIANEQPLMADLFREPAPSDVCLICQNLRTMNGTKPVYIDYADSTFVLPISHIRFIEIPAKAYEEAAKDEAGESAASAKGGRQTEPRSPEAVRGKRPKSVGPARSAARTTEPQAAAAQPPDDESDAQPEARPDTVVLLGSAYHDQGLDNDLLRRIREA